MTGRRGTKFPSYPLAYFSSQCPAVRHISLKVASSLADLVAKALSSCPVQALS